MDFVQNFKKLREKISNRKGFTLIELLIVIAIIGFLAAAVLAALNPIEQINRGRDTRTRADAAALLGGIERYFASNQVYPWNTASDTDLVASRYFASTTDWSAWPLVSSQELKGTVLTRINADNRVLVMKLAGANATTYTCFQPQSASLQQEARRNCDAGAVPSTTGVTGAPTLCPAGTSTTNIYLCLP